MEKTPLVFDHLCVFRGIIGTFSALCEVEVELLSQTMGFSSARYYCEVMGGEEQSNQGGTLSSFEQSRLKWVFVFLLKSISASTVQ